MRFKKRWSWNSLEVSKEWVIETKDLKTYISKFLKNPFIILVIILFIINLCFFGLRYLENKKFNNMVTENYLKTKKYYQLVDNYSIKENKPLSEFFNEETSLKRLIDFNKTLDTTFPNNFFEFFDNHIELIGNYNKDSSLVNGGEKNKDQKVVIKNEPYTITPIDTVHLNQKTFDLFDLSIYDGRGFEDTDFIYVNDEPVNVLT